MAADPSQRLKLGKLAGVCAAEGLHLANLALFKGPSPTGWTLKPDRAMSFPDFTFGTHAIEVAVDTETGEVTVLESVACHDVGRAINRDAGDGQIQGGSAQGLGYALTENYIVRQGVTLTPSLAEYLVPTSSISQPPRPSSWNRAPGSVPSEPKGSANRPYPGGGRRWRMPWPMPWACQSMSCRSRRSTCSRQWHVLQRGDWKASQRRPPELSEWEKGAVDQPYDLLLVNGLVVTGQGVRRADVAVNGDAHRRSGRRADCRGSTVPRHRRPREAHLPRHHRCTRASGLPGRR